jgi:hypothetical protein
LKKIISISFLLIYLLSTTEMVELVKLPVLFEHFQEHKKWDNKITFCEFIVAHYAESTRGNPDYDLDKKLPFKSHTDHAAAPIWIAAEPYGQPYVFQASLIFLIRSLTFDYHDSQPLCSILKCIWQPPQFC